MFGSLRLFLALWVCLSHLGLSIAGHNPGVIAVVVFYLISGYVTRALIDDHLRTPSSFYLERAVRLAPSYWGAFALSATIWFIWTPPSYFLQRDPGLDDWAANILLVPLNFFMWTGQDKFTLVPPAWSLAVELQFYFLAPFLFRRERVLQVLAITSVSIFLLASFRIINTDWWGYRLLPGVLFMFLLGGSVRRGLLFPSVMIFALSAMLLLLYVVKSKLVAPFNVETAVGLLFGLPALAFLARLPRRWWDDAVGRLAYPLFLLHFPVLWVFEVYGFTAAMILSGPILLASYLFTTLIVSALLYSVTEAPLVAWRHRVRCAIASKSVDRPSEKRMHL